MQYKTLHALEACLDTLHEEIFIDAGWRDFFRRKKTQILPQTQVKSPMQQRMQHSNEEASFDYELRQAYEYGRIMLEHKQKMGVLYEQCRLAGLNFDNNGIVLLGRHPVTNNNFSVFWYSHGQFYIYADITGYGTFRYSKSVVLHLQNNQGKLLKKDDFFRGRLTNIIKLHGMMDTQDKSRLLTLSAYEKVKNSMVKCGFTLTTDTANEFNPLKGTRFSKATNSTNSVHLFFDTQYKFYEIDSHGKVVKILIENKVDDLLQTMIQYAKNNK